MVSNFFCTRKRYYYQFLYLFLLSVLLGIASSTIPLIPIVLILFLIINLLIIYNSKIVFLGILFLYPFLLGLTSPVFNMGFKYANIPLILMDLLIVYLFIVKGIQVLFNQKGFIIDKSILFQILMWMVTILFFTLTILYSNDIKLGIVYVRRMLIPILMMILSTCYIKNERDFNHLIFTLILVVILQFGISIYQLKNNLPMYGTFYHDANFTIYLSFFLLLIIWEITYRQKHKLIYYASLLTGLFPFVFSGQRTAWIAFLFGSMLLALKNKKIVIIYSIITVFFLIFAKEIVLERFELLTSVSSGINYDTGNSMGWRLYLWEHMFNEVKKNLVFGRGLGSSNAFVGSIYPDMPYAPHNEYLRLLYETGIIGLLLFLVSLSFQPILIFKNKSLPVMREYKLLLNSYLVVFLVSMAPDNIIIMPEALMVYFVVLGSVTGLITNNDKKFY
ncbi:hypothetical conserved protein [Geobacillus kaustophilus HTA426]|uniref:Hypothetical conserved protein n=1 Tax=Geobacillus kaustophilus (strain HTA426) TaxID=235909 RepID=Q5KUN7_GEOKA|nr:O-antigen ligase family protein [Geobacillus kaustophilus]BAD77599.1 hypothetical conserved protein [Geobacillus kaustophilus HTA426]